MIKITMYINIILIIYDSANSKHNLNNKILKEKILDFCI